MITTMLFDIDGVLLVGDAWNKELATVQGITNEMLSSFFKGPFPACLCGKADLKTEIVPYLTRWGWSQSVEDFINYWFQRYILNEQLLKRIQQLRQCGVKCYLATQQERYRTDYLWHTLDFATLFDGMFSSVDIGYMKSDARFFEIILRKLDDPSPANVLFWDDSAQNVTIARSASIGAEVYSDFASFLATMHTYTDALPQ